MFNFVGLMVLSEALGAIKEHNDFYERVNKLPKEERNALVAARQKHYAEKEAHRKALEIANALRPRNFWGE